MELQKWNRETHEYDKYVTPEEWKCLWNSDDYSEECNCAQCGKVMTVNDGYTSREVHTDLGLGYIVCEECYGREWERENLWDKIDELLFKLTLRDKAVNYYVDIVTGLKKYVEECVGRNNNCVGEYSDGLRSAYGNVLDKIKELEGNLNGVLR